MECLDGWCQWYIQQHVRSKSRMKNGDGLWFVHTHWYILGGVDPNTDGLKLKSFNDDGVVNGFFPICLRGLYSNVFVILHLGCIVTAMCAAIVRKWDNSVAMKVTSVPDNSCACAQSPCWC